MVFFTCLNCNESLQKPKVAKHYMGRCHGPIIVTCVDCLKDFRGNEYEAHVKCISEEERYAAKGFVAKPTSCKGEKKQQTWFEAVQNILTTSSELKHDERELLQILSTQENLPRKKGKFLNFIANAHRAYARRQELIERVWNIIEQAGKAAIETKPEEEKVTNKAEGDKTNGVNDKEPSNEIKEKRIKKKKNRENGVEQSDEVNGKEATNEKEEKRIKKEKIKENGVDPSDEVSSKKSQKRKSHKTEEEDSKKIKLEETTSQNVVLKIINEEAPESLYKLLQSLEKHCAEIAGVEKGPKKYKKLLKNLSVELKDGTIVLNTDKLN